MLRDFLLMAFLAMMLACGQAEFATRSDTASAAPTHASDDSSVDPENEAGWEEMDFPDEVELDDDGDGDDCVDTVKRSNCYLTSDFRMVCKEVTLTSLRR